MRRRAFLALMTALLAATATIDAEGPLVGWTPRDIPNMTKRGWEAASNRTRAEVLRLILAARTWGEFVESVQGTWEYREDPAFLSEIAVHVTDPTFAALQETDFLIIWERIVSGDLVYSGRGYQVEDDLFTLAGRANYTLRRVTGKNFGYVKPGTSAEDLSALQGRWKAHLAGEKPETPALPDFSGAGGPAPEVRSPVAVEALVRSLAPSPEKAAFTKRCLARTGLTELPTDPLSPQRFCNTDEYALLFLKQLTGIDADHPAEWWAEWWERNHDRLRWDPEAVRFEVASSTDAS